MTCSWVQRPYHRCGAQPSRAPRRAGRGGSIGYRQLRGGSPDRRLASNVILSTVPVNGNETFDLSSGLTGEIELRPNSNGSMPWRSTACLLAQRIIRVPFWNWARVRGGARGAHGLGEWSWALMGPWWASMGPLGPKGAFSPDLLDAQGDNSAHAQWAPARAPMGPSWAPAGPSGRLLSVLLPDLLLLLRLRAWHHSPTRSGPGGPLRLAPALSLGGRRPEGFGSSPRPPPQSGGASE